MATLFLSSFAMANQPALEHGFCPLLDTVTTERLRITASLFLNATRSGIQGENYLLNEQLSNIKLNTDLRLDEWNRFHSVLIYNTAPTPINPELYFDEAYLQTKNIKRSPWYLQLGRKWLTFGNYKNDLIYKPFTKALGQTREYAVIAGYENKVYANMSAFFPYTHVRSAALPFAYNVNTGVKDQQGRFSYDAGVSYLCSMTDTQALQFNKGFGGLLGRSVYHAVPAAAAYLNLQDENWNTYLTYVTALHPFNRNVMSFQNVGARPGAFSIQSGYNFNLHGTRFKAIGFYDNSFQALALLLPKRRIGAEINVYPTPYMDVQLQYSRDYNYTPGETAQGLGKTINGANTKTNTVALQIVLYFK